MQEAAIALQLDQQVIIATPIQVLEKLLTLTNSAIMDKYKQAKSVRGNGHMWYDVTEGIFNWNKAV